MRNLTLKQLRYFQALSRFGHFGQAAEACSISQPALSVQIKELEANTGAQLFERGPKQVRLTSFGEEFAARVRDILRSIDDLEDFARASDGRFAGRLRIGIIPTIAPYLLPRILRTLAATYNDVDIHVRETVTPRLIEELSDGGLDAAIVALPISEPSFCEVTLFSESILLVRPEAEGHGPPPDAHDLSKMKLLLLEEGHCFRDQALAFCDMRSGVRREGLDGSSLSTLVQMVAAGLGVTFIPEMARTVETMSVPVSVTPFPDPQPHRTVGMIWRRSSPLSDRLRQLSKLLREATSSNLANIENSNS